MELTSGDFINAEVAGKRFTLKSSEPENLEKATSYINERLEQLAKEKPLAKSSDLQILLLLELALERFETQEKGKALLKRTDQLVEWVRTKIKDC